MDPAGGVPSLPEAALLQGRPPTGAGHYVRDIVYGANDGAITTFAVVAGVAGASLAPAVALILGLANLVADGLSMAASNYLSLKSDLEQRGFAPGLERPFRHALATFAAFVVAGGLPLAAYLALPHNSPASLGVAAVLVLIVLAIVGVWRARFVRRSRWRSALEMTLVGGAAGTAAYAVGWGARLAFGSG